MEENMSERFSRQGFLGEDSEKKISVCKVGIVGLGGGGSHIVQQLSHVGFRDFVLYDSQIIDESNLNRLVGSRFTDVKEGKPKVEIGKRLITELVNSAKVEAYQESWQNNPLPLRSCDIIFGCVDSFAQRMELETCARRFLIPYIDIGLDIHNSPKSYMMGQVILSMPGGLCMQCLNVLNEENLAKEAQQYGEAGIRPQVVWANGVLASCAVGICVDMITGWTRNNANVIYLNYDGNLNLVFEDRRLKHLREKSCCHYALNETGAPIPKKT